MRRSQKTEFGIAGRLRIEIAKVLGRSPAEEAERRYRAKIAKENFRVYYRNRKILDNGGIL